MPDEVAPEAEITELPVEVVEVRTKPTAVKTKVGSEDFIEQFKKLIMGGNVWRTPKSLAEKLGVDPVDLAAWMDKQQPLCRKPGKEDGTVYYAAVERVQIPEEKRPPGMDRKVVTEEDRYMLAEFNLVLNNLYDVLDKHGMRAYERSEEGFKAIVQARDRLDAGVALLINRTNSDRSKMTTTNNR